MRTPGSDVAAFDREERTIQIQVGAPASGIGTLRSVTGTVPIAERTVPTVQRTPPNAEGTVPTTEGTVPIRVRTLAMPAGTVPTSKRTTRLPLRTVAIPLGTVPIPLRTLASPVGSVPIELPTVSIPIGGVPPQRAPAARPRQDARNLEPLAEKPERIAGEHIAGPRRPLARNRQRRYASETYREDPVDQNEFERRKRAIEEQLLADIEVLRAAARIKIAALEALASAKPRSASPDHAKTPAPSPAREVRLGGTMHDIMDTLPQLPEVFDKTDVSRILGFEPNRAALHRACNRLVSQKKIVMEVPGHDRQPTKFRKLKPE